MGTIFQFRVIIAKKEMRCVRKYYDSNCIGDRILTQTGNDLEIDCECFEDAFLIGNKYGVRIYSIGS